MGRRPEYIEPGNSGSTGYPWQVTQPAANLRALILTNEYPPHVYGGAGVHVDKLSDALRRHARLEVRAFGDQDEQARGWRVRGYPAPPDAPGPVWSAFARNLAMAADPTDAQLVHCHTWYTHLAGVLLQRAAQIPLVVTVHSLEPLRPWKEEQLGDGYRLSAWVERLALESADAVIAVSTASRDDVLRLFDVVPERVRVIHNGIDPDEFFPDPTTDALERFGVDPSRPYLLFVGRATRQKGIIHLVRALREIDPQVGVVLAAGQPDTPQIAAELEAAVDQERARRPHLVWIGQMLSRAEARQLYSHAAAFVCPSVYEPFGIINLEAMACGTPVVASATGGIPEVVVDGETGLLVPLGELTGDGSAPRDAAPFEHALATAINALLADPVRRAAMGEAGRRRAAAEFSWKRIAGDTLELYRGLLR